MPAHMHETPVRSGTSGGCTGAVEANRNKTGSVIQTDINGGNQPHSHPMTSGNNMPEFKTILLCKKD